METLQEITSAALELTLGEEKLNGIVAGGKGSCEVLRFLVKITQCGDI